MRNILLLTFLILMSSCRNTQEITNVQDDVYDVSDHTTKSSVDVYDEDEFNYRSYNDIVYNDPWIYNSYRFGFGVGMGSPLYYGPYWGNSWYWGNPYGYYNPWNSGIYYNQLGYCGYDWSHHHGFYGDTDFGYGRYIFSPRPSMMGRSSILNPHPRLNNYSLSRPYVESQKTTNTHRTNTHRPTKSNDIRISPPPSPNRIIRNNPPRVNPSRNDRSLPRNPSPSPRSPRSPRR